MGKNDKQWIELYKHAYSEGLKAGNGHNPNPMLVTQHENPFDDDSPIEQSWVVSDGVCGFAWVTIRPGTSSFARWLVKTGKGSKAYYGGINISIREFNQSYERKLKMAQKMAEIFGESKINAYASGRLD